MKIPKYVKKENKRYIFIKQYPNFVLYEDVITKTKEAFQYYDLGLVKEVIERTRNVANAKIKF